MSKFVATMAVLVGSVFTWYYFFTAGLGFHVASWKAVVLSLVSFFCLNVIAAVLSGEK